MNTKITKRYKNLTILTFWLSVLLTICPILIYVARAFLSSEVQSVNKYTLGIMCSVALIVTIINIVAKLRLRCIPWILLLGIYICLKEITSLLVIMAITTIIDEMIVTPLHKSLKNKYIINKEMDKRLNNG